MLSTLLFSKIERSKTRPPLVLETLGLDNINLTYAQRTYMQFIEFSKLKKLELNGGGGTDVLLHELADAFRSGHAECSLFDFELTGSDIRLEVLCDFLKSSSGLKKLSVRIAQDPDMPRPCFGESLMSHCSTLTCLLLETGTMEHYLETEGADDPYEFGGKELQVIASTCRHLEEVSLCFPTWYTAELADSKVSRFTIAMVSIQSNGSE